MSDSYEKLSLHPGGLSLHPGGLSLTLDGANAAGMKAGDTVLDIGCGPGTSLAFLEENLGIIPFGIDKSETSIRKALHLHPSIHAQAGDAAALPYADGTFNHVMLECILTLLEDPEAALAESIRVLAPDGHLIISSLTGPGLLDPAWLTARMCESGLQLTYQEDRTKDLTQYMIDTILEYGNLANRIQAEKKLTGASVFDCSQHLDRKQTRYWLYVYQIEEKAGLYPNAKAYHNAEANHDAEANPNAQASAGSVKIDKINPSQAGYGTPVDALVAKRIGLSPAELTQEAVEKYQLEAFRRTLRYAKENSLFYKEHLAGIDPDKIIDMKDLKTIPTTSEEDLAGNERRFQCLNASRVDRIVTVPVLGQASGRNSGSDSSMVTLPTSGTSGRQKRISYTAADQKRSIDFINRGFMTMNCKPGERMLIFMSGTSPGSIGDLVARAMEPLQMDIRVYGSVTDIADAYKALMEFRPQVVEALPWHAAALARYGTSNGNPEKEFIRSVNLSADVVPDAIVRRLESLWSCTVHRHYGTTEMAIFGGVECLHHQGYHTRPCDILYEIPETDPDGYGELLITTLDREAMPFIRYKTGDIARFTDNPCLCGCRLRRIERFRGRMTSLISVPGASFYLADLADALYKIPEIIDFDVYVSDKDASGRDASGKDELGKDGAGKVGAGKVGSGKNGSGRNETVRAGSDISCKPDFDNSGLNENTCLKIIGRTLPKELISPDIIKNSLLSLAPGLRAAMENRGCDACDMGDAGNAGNANRGPVKEAAFNLQICVEETNAFPSGYNLKKKVRRKVYQT